MKFLSEVTPEVLGHCGMGMLIGGRVLSYYVSWSCPLEFGYARVRFPPVIALWKKVLFYAGGILTCLLAAVSTQVLLLEIAKRKEKKRLWTIIGIHCLFWYGFWAFMNSTGYLLIGSVLHFGDIKMIASLLGVSSYIFMLPGVLLLVILYYLISYNVYTLFSSLIPWSAKRMVFTFWLILPITVVFFILNPAIYVKPLFFLCLWCCL